jgi:UDP-N-acetylmuramoyl-tripeptide--D-alanyl-D-alanine ligase
LVGDDMQSLIEALDGAVPVERAADASEAADKLDKLVQPGDAVLVKASNSIGLARLVERVAGGSA